MTVPTSDNREEYIGNDTTTVFPYAFKIFRNEDLQVYVVESDSQTLQTLGTDYSVSGAGHEDGGNVTMTTAPTASQELIILRIVEIVQETDLRNQGAYYPETVEDEFDRSRMIDQQQQDEIDRTLSRPEALDYWDAQDRVIRNVAEGVEDDDAVNKGQMDARFTNDVITKTGSHWDGKGLQARNFTTRNPPSANDLMTFSALQSYVADIESGAVGDATQVTASGTGDKRTLADWMKALGYPATSTGTQALADALDSRVIHVNSLASRDAIPTSGLADKHSVHVSGVGDFMWSVATSKWLPDSDTVTPEMFGGDLVAWAAYPSKKHYGGPGNYASASDVVFAPGSTVELSEDFVFTGPGQFLCEGTLPEIATLAADVAAGDYTLTFSAAHNLAPGDIVRLWSTVDYSWSTHRPYYHAGEDVRIYSVTSATEVSLAAPLMYSYLAADMRCFTFGANKGFRMTGGTFVNSDAGYSIQARYLVGVEIHPHKLTAETLGTGGVSIDKCYSIDMSCRYANVFSPDSGLQYAFLISNSTRWTLTGNGSSTRHVMAIGGDSALGSIPSRHGRINDAVLSGVTATGADAHGNADDIIYSQCIINGGALLGGKDIIYDKCTITEYRPSTGYCVLSGEVVGGYYRLVDCVLISQSNPRTTGFNLVSIANEGASGVAVYPCAVEIIRPICRAPNHTGGVLQVLNDSTAPPISILVDSPDFTECPAMAFGPMLLQGTGVANFGDIVLRSPRGLPNGVGYLDTSSAAIDWNSTKSEFPTQFGTAVVTGSGGAQAATTASFKHPYPFAPGVAISGDVFYEGGQLAVPIAKSISASSFDATLASSAGGALTAATSGTLRWIASAATL